ncbi:SGNH/GDSL hydrolase family protein [Streptomyces sp. NBC_01622]|uniref:SGNH/GDSL hydrolase family protein n=1 Tax=Streptomyces sp. NBC_01622 TaxID=2975903 RepID=UPI003865FE31|nr:SGNH/GDSL hydrolase family protein [Streptomyces sp. NBC_01622]
MRKPWIVGVLLAGVLLGACTDPASGPEVTPPTPSVPSSTHRQVPVAPVNSAPAVLYLGDSLAVESQNVLGRELRNTLDATYTSAPYSGTTPCDYLEGAKAGSLVPDADKAATLVRSLHPDYVVLQFWGNAWAYTPCMDGITYAADRETYFARYRADVRKLTAQIAAAGGAQRPTIVWVLQGPDPITPERVQAVNALYKAQTRSTRDTVADAGKAVSPAGARYTWAQYLPCTAYERAHPDYCTQPGNGRTTLHRDDDYLHFCLAPTTSTPRPCPVRSPGILRMAREITRAIGARAPSRSAG